MRTSVGKSTAVLRSNNANSPLRLTVRQLTNEILNKRIGSAQNLKVITFNPAPQLTPTVVVLVKEEQNETHS